MEGDKIRYIVHRVENVTTLIQTQKAIKHLNIRNYGLYGIMAVIVVIFAIIFDNQNSTLNKDQKQLHALISKNCQGGAVGVQLFNELDLALSAQRNLLFHSPVFRADNK